MKERKNALLKVRCETALKTDLETVAKLQRLDVSDIVRMASALYVDNVLRSVSPITNAQRRFNQTA